VAEFVIIPGRNFFVSIFCGRKETYGSTFENLRLNGFKLIARVHDSCAVDRKPDIASGFASRPPAVGVEVKPIVAWLLDVDGPSPQNASFVKV